MNYVPPGNIFARVVSPLSSGGQVYTTIRYYNILVCNGSALKQGGGVSFSLLLNLDVCCYECKEDYLK